MLSTTPAGVGDAPIVERFDPKEPIHLVDERVTRDSFKEASHTP
jgi:hypothetical protein